MKKTMPIGKMTRLFAGIALILLAGVWRCAVAATIIRGDTLKKNVVAYVKQNMPWPEDTVRIEFLGDIDDVKLAGKNIACRVQGGKNEDFIGNASFTVRFYADDLFLKKEIIRLRLEVLMEIATAATFLARDTRIEYRDVELNRIWLTRAPRNVITTLDGVVGKTVRNDIKPNTAITRTMIKIMPVVKRRKPVKIVFKDDLMRITTIGVSEQDGMLGDLVKVRNVSSSQMIYARVIGDDMVRVEF